MQKIVHFKPALILLFLAAASTIFCELTVTIDPPTLAGEGMDNLQALLDANIGVAVVDIQEMAADMLTKPLLTGSCGKAAGIAGVMGIIGSTSYPGEVLFSTNLITGIETDVYDWDVLVDRFENFEPEDDYSLGAGFQGAAVALTLPLDFIVPRTYINIAGSYLSLSTDDFFVKGYSATFGLGWSPFRPLSNAMIAWLPLTLKGGGSWTNNRLIATIDAGTITESIEIGAGGPLISQSITIEVNPIIDVGISDEIWSFAGSLSTEVNIFRFISLNIGGGALYLTGTTAITAESSADIVIQGYLADLIGDDPEDQGKVNISGGVEGGEPTLFSGFLFGALRFDMGPAYINIPVIYQSPNTIGAGVYFGVSL